MKQLKVHKVVDKSRTHDEAALEQLKVHRASETKKIRESRLTPEGIVGWGTDAKGTGTHVRAGEVC